MREIRCCPHSVRVDSRWFRPSPPNASTHPDEFERRLAPNRNKPDTLQQKPVYCKVFITVWNIISQCSTVSFLWRLYYLRTDTSIGKIVVIFLTLIALDSQHSFLALAPSILSALQRRASIDVTFARCQKQNPTLQKGKMVLSEGSLEKHIKLYLRQYKRPFLPHKSPANEIDTAFNTQETADLPVQPSRDRL